MSLDLCESRAVRGWRCWRVVPEGLAALVDAHGIWSTGRMRAKCQRTPTHPPSSAPAGHTAPHPACTCWINGYADRSEAETTMEFVGAWQPLVLGEMHLWGKVLVRGATYRAEFAG